MFGIGGLNSFSLLATAALGPGGGIMAQLATQMYSQMGQQLIQLMGNNMGLPQSQIDFAQSSFTGRIGDFAGSVQNFNEGSFLDTIETMGQRTGASPSDIGGAQRDAQEALSQVLNDLAQNDEVREARSGGGRGGSWLRAMAEVLGQKLDDLAHEMQDLAGRVNKDDPSTSTDFTVVSQEFNMLMNAVTNALKTIGEAMGKSAARQ